MLVPDWLATVGSHLKHHNLCHIITATFKISGNVLEEAQG